MLTGCNAPTSTASPTPSAANEAQPTSQQNPSPSEEHSFLIVPGKGFGPITSQSTKETLIEHFGADQVREESISLIEGLESPGVAIFPDDPPTRVEVTFFDQGHGTVDLIQTLPGGSLWATADGLTVGTELSELERINGGPFEFTGFGWDYGGQVVDWKGGKIEDLQISLDADLSELTDEEFQAVTGDQIISSDELVLKKVSAEVTKIQILFPRSE